jgi:hypothetical protein
MRHVKIIVVYARRSPVVWATRRSPPQITECVRILFTVCVRSRFSRSQIISFFLLQYFISFRREEQRRRNCPSAVSVVTTSGDKRRSSVLFSDQSLTQSVSVDDDLKPDFKDRYLPSNTVISSSVEGLHWHGPKSAAKHWQDQSALPAGTIPTVASATVPPHLPGMTKSTFRAYSGLDAV